MTKWYHLIYLVNLRKKKVKAIDWNRYIFVRGEITKHCKDIFSGSRGFYIRLNPSSEVWWNLIFYIIFEYLLNHYGTVYSCVGSFIFVLLRKIKKVDTIRIKKFNAWTR